MRDPVEIRTQTLNDDILRQATGLHIDVVRRLVTERVFTPEQSGGGRGRMRVWKLKDFWRAALVAAFMRNGLPTPISAPLVRELNDSWLRQAVEKHVDFEIAIYEGFCAFIEAPAAYVARAQPEGVDNGWRNNRLLIADYNATTRTWSGFDNTVWFCRRDRFGPFSERASHAEREEALEKIETGERAHAAAEEYRFVMKLHLTRVLLAAERERHALMEVTS